MAVAHKTTCQNFCSLCLKRCKETGFISNLYDPQRYQISSKSLEILKTIPKGKVKTYKQVAIGINRSKSTRAVTNACAKNPYAPKIPCHRVIRSDGTLGGFSSPGGTKTKKKLLKKEGFSL